jgi:GDP/UDP-N,N'-diacetylbacillosamine 2-epimerase (hydrolysing)
MKKLRETSFASLDIIAFGTHVSEFYGKTVDDFYKYDFDVAYELESLVLGDSPEAISSSMGLTVTKFSSIWARENYDLIIVLGDRYEMFSAISASVPFNIPVAHLHGGETTEGAIDNKFRHCITSMSELHFVSTKNHAERVKQILGKEKNIYNVGAPALDNLNEIALQTKQEFYDEWEIDLKKPTVLTTFHPETVALEKNLEYVRELCQAMEEIEKQFVITLPNNDTLGTEVRAELLKFANKDSGKYKVVEALGTVSYYSCMKFCEYLLGNSSSGIIEAASFNKYVINIGDRQKGRDFGENIFHVPAKKEKILDAADEIENMGPFKGKNIYGDRTATDKIVNIIEHYFE